MVDSAELVPTFSDVGRQPEIAMAAELLLLPVYRPPLLFPDVGRDRTMSGPFPMSWPWPKMWG